MVLSDSPVHIMAVRIEDKTSCIWYYKNVAVQKELIPNKITSFTPGLLPHVQVYVAKQLLASVSSHWPSLPVQY